MLSPPSNHNESDLSIYRKRINCHSRCTFNCKDIENLISVPTWFAILWATLMKQQICCNFFLIIRKPCFKCLIVHRINFVNIEYKFVVVFQFLIVFIHEITDYSLLLNIHFLWDLLDKWPIVSNAYMFTAYTGIILS